MMLQNLGQSEAMIKLMFLMQVKNVSWNNNTYKSQITQLENVFNNKIAKKQPVKFNLLKMAKGKIFKPSRANFD